MEVPPFASQPTRARARAGHCKKRQICRIRALDVDAGVFSGSRVRLRSGCTSDAQARDTGCGRRRRDRGASSSGPRASRSASTAPARQRSCVIARRGATSCASSQCRNRAASCRGLCQRRGCNRRTYRAVSLRGSASGNRCSDGTRAFTCSFDRASHGWRLGTLAGLGPEIDGPHCHRPARGERAACRVRAVTLTSRAGSRCPGYELVLGGVGWSSWGRVRRVTAGMSGCTCVVSSPAGACPSAASSTRSVGVAGRVKGAGRRSCQARR